MPIDEHVEGVYDSAFGVALFNAYTQLREPSKRFLFSKRLIVVKRMLRAVLDAEKELLTEGESSLAPHVQVVQTSSHRESR